MQRYRQIKLDKVLAEGLAMAGGVHFGNGDCQLGTKDSVERAACSHRAPGGSLYTCDKQGQRVTLNGK